LCAGKGRESERVKMKEERNKRVRERQKDLRKGLESKN
jgi:hypothetical protein